MIGWVCEECGAGGGRQRVEHGARSVGLVLGGWVVCEEWGVRGLAWGGAWREECGVWRGWSDKRGLRELALGWCARFWGGKADHGRELVEKLRCRVSAMGNGC